MILLSWFYMSGLVILVGAEMNAAIEHASPHGKDRGEKVAGQKGRIPLQAMRHWIRLRHARGRTFSGTATATADRFTQTVANITEEWSRVQ